MPSSKLNTGISSETLPQNKNKNRNGKLKLTYISIFLKSPTSPALGTWSGVQGSITPSPKLENKVYRDSRGTAGYLSTA